MKNSNTLATLFFSALAAAAPLQQRGYNTVVVTTTAITTHWLEYGEAPPSAATPIVEGQEEVQPEVPVPAVTSSEVPAVPTSVVVPNVPAVSSTAVSSTIVDTPVVPTLEPVVPVVTSSAVVPAPSSTAAAADAPSGGAGGANPFYPSGPKVGDSQEGIRLSPMFLYGSQPGSQVLDHHIGACGKYPYDQNDPVLSMTDAAGDHKLMFNPPNGDILSYCGATLKITGPDGRTSTGIVTDSCADCGGPGGMDMMAAGWAEVGDPTDSPVANAKWEIIEWATIAPIAGYTGAGA